MNVINRFKVRFSTRGRVLSSYQHSIAGGPRPGSGSSVTSAIDQLRFEDNLLLTESEVRCDATMQRRDL